MKLFCTIISPRQNKVDMRTLSDQIVVTWLLLLNLFTFQSHRFTAIQSDKSHWFNRITWRDFSDLIGRSWPRVPLLWPRFVMERYENKAISNNSVSNLENCWTWRWASWSIATFWLAGLSHVVRVQLFGLLVRVSWQVVRLDAGLGRALFKSRQQCQVLTTGLHRCFNCCILCSYWLQ